MNEKPREYTDIDTTKLLTRYAQLNTKIQRILDKDGKGDLLGELLEIERELTLREG
jgi:hypothetical protein